MGTPRWEKESHVVRAVGPVELPGCPHGYRGCLWPTGEALLALHSPSLPSAGPAASGQGGKCGTHSFQAIGQR